MSLDNLIPYAARSGLVFLALDHFLFKVLLSSFVFWQKSLSNSLSINFLHSQALLALNHHFDPVNISFPLLVYLFSAIFLLFLLFYKFSFSNHLYCSCLLMLGLLFSPDFDCSLPLMRFCNHSRSSFLFLALTAKSISMATKKSTKFSSFKRASKQPFQRPRPTTSSKPLLIKESHLDWSVYSAICVLFGGFVQFCGLGGDPRLDMFYFQQWNDFMQINKLLILILSATFIVTCSVISRTF